MNEEKYAMAIKEENIKNEWEKQGYRDSFNKCIDYMSKRGR